MKFKLVAFILFFYTLSFSQSIEGIGPFKLGRSTFSSIDSLFRKQNLKEIIVVGNDKAYSKKGIKNTYIKRMPNLENLADNDYDDYLIDDSFTVDIENLIINNKYKIKKATLQFVNNVLYKMILKDPDSQLKSDLELKFGTPTIKSLERDERCYVGNERLSFKTNSYHSFWKSYDEKISISYSISENRRDNGCERYISIYIIGDAVIPHEFESANISLRSSLEERLKSEKIEQLKDL